MDSPSTSLLYPARYLLLFPRHLCRARLPRHLTSLLFPTPISPPIRPPALVPAPLPHRFGAAPIVAAPALCRCCRPRSRPLLSPALSLRSRRRRRPAAARRCSSLRGDHGRRRHSPRPSLPPSLTRVHRGPHRVHTLLLFTVVPAPPAAASDRRLALLPWPAPTCREGKEGG
jgi:hypothetical protein